MRNLDNSLRKYNKRVLHRTKMHLYTKKHIDTCVHKAFFMHPKVHLLKLSSEDINQYKEMSFNEEEFEAYLSEKYSYQPARKIIIRQIENKKSDILKLVLSREGETDTFKSKFKSAPCNTNEKKSTSVVTEPQPMEISYEEFPESTGESSKSTEEPSKHTEETSKSTEETLKSTEEPLKSTEETLKSTEETSKSTKESSDKNLTGKIRLVNFKELIDEKYHYLYITNFLGLNPDPSINGIKNIVTPNNVSIDNTSMFSKGQVDTRNLSLLGVENLYNKYFSKAVQDSIVIIANILNIISMSNKHHKARMDESFKKKTEAEKLKERCDANRIHLRHKKVLESKLKKNFVDVISSFEDSEFEHTFQMFFLSILTVLRVLDQPKFKKGSIFKNLVLLLWNSLKNSEFEHPKVFTMFRSKSFRPDCIDLISLIEDSRDNDPGITDRMALFFVSSVNSQEHFKSVIKAVTSDCNEDLGLLLDNASFQCCRNSKFEDPINYSKSLMNKSINEKPLTSIQNTIRHGDGIQHWVIAQTSNGTYQPIPMTSENKLQKTTNMTIESCTGKPLNTFYESFSNSLPRVSSESIIPKVGVIASTPSVASTSLGQTTTFLTFKPTIHNIKPITTTTIQRPEGGNTIMLGNKHYQLIRRPINQVKAVTTQNHTSNNILIRSNPIVDVPIKCFATNCKNPATIMCSSCTSVKYCSHSCQRLDWYESHIHNCERLLKSKQNNI